MRVAVRFCATAEVTTNSNDEHTQDALAAVCSALPQRVELTEEIACITLGGVRAVVVRPNRRTVLNYERHDLWWALHLLAASFPALEVVLIATAAEERPGNVLRVTFSVDCPHWELQPGHRIAPAGALPAALLLLGLASSTAPAPDPSMWNSMDRVYDAIRPLDLVLAERFAAPPADEGISRSFEPSPGSSLAATSPASIATLDDPEDLGDAAHDRIHRRKRPRVVRFADSVAEESGVGDQSDASSTASMAITVAPPPAAAHAVPAAAAAAGSAEEDLTAAAAAAVAAAAVSAPAHARKRRRRSETSPLPFLPDELWLSILRYVDAATLRAFGCCSRRAHNLSRVVIPGLRLTLFPHQAISLRWMIFREAVKGIPALLHPFILTVTDGDTGEPAYVSLDSGLVSLDRPDNWPVETRGGLLCDDPGLGKTITVLSLILRDLGIRCERHEFDLQRERAAAIRRTWKAYVPEDRAAIARSLISQIVRRDALAEFFYNPVDPELYPDYRNFVQHPRCLKDILDRDGNYASLDDMLQDFQLVFDNAMAYNPADHPLHQFAFVTKQFCREHFRQLEEQLACGRRGGYDRAYAEHQRLDALYESGATLLVVPGHLFDHWKQQILLHTDRAHLSLQHCYFDDFRAELAHPAVLSSKYLVLTTFSRFSHHQAANLQEVHWLRLVVDEGHNLGKNQSSNYVVNIDELHADRRWIMTGTPTPSTDIRGATRMCAAFFRAIRQAPFTGSLWSRAWHHLYVRPIGHGRPDTMLRLRDVLQQLMVRHRKVDIHLPAPIVTTHLLDPSPSERKTYNALVAFAATNIMLNGLEGDTASGQNSLLLHSNRNHARRVLSNLQIACCGGWRMRAAVSNADKMSMMAMLQNENPAQQGAFPKVDEFLFNAQNSRTTECERCHRDFMILTVTPCAHLICPFCPPVDKRCPVCTHPINIDTYQALQPGLMLDFEADTTPYVPGGLANIDVVGQNSLSTKALFLIRDLATSSRDGSIETPKAIVFSEFRNVLNWIGDKLIRHFGPESVAEYWGSRKDAELEKFRVDPNCRVMLLGMIGSRGLDLSFATHIYLLDEIWDRALYDQVVARAWRMGTRTPCKIRKLIMRGSLEEDMHRINNAMEDGVPPPWMTEEVSGDVDNVEELPSQPKLASARLCYLLTHLQPIA
eukprot:m.175107 g.175107  ORF g.175107 m.175107 type:complete len:1162 (-) comp10420_c0_seq15:114-3599(-)